MQMEGNAPDLPFAPIIAAIEEAVTIQRLSHAGGDIERKFELVLLLESGQIG
jgi:hypothetical protein